MGVKKSSIQKYEGGSVSNLKMDTIRTLCNYFRVPPYVFIFPEYVKNENDLMKIKSDKHLVSNINTFLALNQKGKQKVIDYIHDLADTKKYTY